MEKNENCTTLVLGASENPDRTSYTAIEKLRQNGIKTYALGIRPGKVSDVAFITDPGEIPAFDILTLYINPGNQTEYESWICEKWKPRKVVFNPGSENPVLAFKAASAGIKVEYACTLILLSLGKYCNQ